MSAWDPGPGVPSSHVEKLLQLRFRGTFSNAGAWQWIMIGSSYPGQLRQGVIGIYLLQRSGVRVSMQKNPHGLAKLGYSSTHSMHFRMPERSP